MKVNRNVEGSRIVVLKKGCLGIGFVLSYIVLKVDRVIFVLRVFSSIVSRVSFVEVVIFER